MRTRMCGTVGAVDKEKTSLHVLNAPLTVSNLHDLDQNFQDQNSGDRPSQIPTIHVTARGRYVSSGRPLF